MPVLVDRDGSAEVLMLARLTLPLFRSGSIVVTIFSFICKTDWIEWKGIKKSGVPVSRNFLYYRLPSCLMKLIPGPTLSSSLLV